MCFMERILFFLLFFAIFVTLVEAARFAEALLSVRKYETTNTRLVLLGASVSYIMTIIFTGLN